MSQTVIVSEEAKGVHVIDPSTEGYPTREIGTVVSRIYEGESVQRHLFIPGVTVAEYQEDQSLDVEKIYRLGPTTTHWEFIDHPTVLAPYLEEGFTVSKMFYGRGGLTMYALLQPPNPKVYQDPIGWDAAFWNGIGRDDERLRGITESVVVTSSIKPKKGIHYQRGWYRLICTNGMVSAVLQWPKLSMSHSQFDIAKAYDYMGLYTAAGSGGYNDVDPGPFIGNLDGVRRLKQWVQNYIATNTVQVSTPDEEEEDDEIAEDIASAVVPGSSLQENIPFAIRKSMEPVMNMPGWYAQELDTQLDFMVQNLSDVTYSIYALDLLNALTNPIYHRTFTNDDYSPIRLLTRAEGLFKTFSNLVGVFSLI